MASSFSDTRNKEVAKMMNKAFLLIGIAVAILSACSGDQRNETSGATGPISPWHSLTKAAVSYTHLRAHET